MAKVISEFRSFIVSRKSSLETFGKTYFKSVLKLPKIVLTKSFPILNNKTFEDA